MYIKSNIEGMQSYLNFARIDSAFNKSLNKISTGMEVPSPGYGGGKFAVANDMEYLYKEYLVGAQNIQDATGVLETFTSLMAEANDILLTMNDLAYRASTDVVNTAQRRQMHAEFSGLRRELNKLLSDAQYNKISLFSAGRAAKTFSILFGESQYITYSTQNLSLISLGVAAAATISTLAGAAIVINSMVAGTNRLNQRMAYIGAEIEGLSAKVNLLNETAVQQKAAESRINELDFAKEMKNFTSLQVVMQASNAMIAQSNMKAQMVLQLFK